MTDRERARMALEDAVRAALEDGLSAAEVRAEVEYVLGES